MPKKKEPPVDLEKYLEAQGHVTRYLSYEEGTRLYNIPYWGFGNSHLFFIQGRKNV